MSTMLNIINSDEISDLIVPGVYTEEPPPSPAAVTGPPTNVLGLDGTASYGPVNIPQVITATGSRTSTTAAVQSVFGRSTSLPYSVVDAVANGAAPEANSLVVNRVTDQTDTSAFFQLLDSTGFATGDIVVGGAFAAGVALSVTFTYGNITVTVNYTTQTSDGNLAGVAASLAAAINNSQAVLGSLAFIQPVTASGNQINVSALSSGTAGNSITMSATGAAITLTPSGALLTGGAAPGVSLTFIAIFTGSAANSTGSNFVGGRCVLSSAPGSTSPTYNVTLYAYNGQVENFQNIPAYAVLGGGFNAAAFQANVFNAVNSGNSQRAASQNWIATVGTSTAPPLTNTAFPAAYGTDGANGVGLSQLLGQNGTSSRTGLYALSGLVAGGTVMIAGLGDTPSDVSLAQTIAAFCQQNACILVLALGPQDTTPDEAVETVQTYGAASRFVLGVICQLYFVDPNSAQSQLENPAGAAAGLISSLGPSISPLNKQKMGITASEWSVGQMPDETVLQSNNISYFKYSGGAWVFFGKTMLDGTPIEDTRMLNFIAPALQEIGNRLLGQSQPAIAPNAILDDYASDIEAFLEAQDISDYNVDLSPNTVTTIEGHTALANVNVQTNSSIWYVLNVLNVGNTVQVSQAA